MRKNMLKVAIIVIVVLIIITGLTMVLIHDEPGEMMKEAFALRDSGMNELAAAKFGDVALVYPDSKYADEALFEKGFTYYVILFPKADNQDKLVFIKLALNAFEKIVQNHPKSDLIDQTRLYLAEIYTAMQEDHKALVNYEAASKRVKDPAKLQEIYHFMAKNYESIGQLERAIDKLKMIIEMGMEGGYYYENAYLSLARFYRIAAEEDVENSEEFHKSVIQMLDQMINSGNQISSSTMQEALRWQVHSQLELKMFDDAEEVIERLEGMLLTPTNKALVEDYKGRLTRHKEMGKQ